MLGEPEVAGSSPVSARGVPGSSVGRALTKIIKNRLVYLVGRLR